MVRMISNFTSAILKPKKDKGTALAGLGGERLYPKLHIQEEMSDSAILQEKKY